MRVLTTIIVSLGFLVSHQALAYIPPSGFILKNMVTKHSVYKSLRVRSTIVSMQKGQPTGNHFKEVAYFDPQSRILKSRAYNDAGKELFGFEKRVSDDSVQPGNLLNAVLFEQNLPSVTRMLKLAGMPVKMESDLLAIKDEKERIHADAIALERWKTQFAWVIGPKSKNGPQPQLWIEKDTFLPIRLVSSSNEEGIDATFENYRYYREFPYPKVISVSKPTAANESFVRIELIDLTVNPEANELKATVRPGFTEQGESADGAVKDLIQAYYQKIR
jgi:hypothetical protein